MFEDLSGNNSKSVLLIDDDNWVHKAVIHYLEKQDITVFSALNPFDGLVMAINNRPDVILLDYILPEIRGDVMLKLLKKIEITEAIPVVIISANIDKELLRFALANGAEAFISKPFTEVVLQEKVQFVLEKPLLESSPA
ncbi:MAG: response regulator [Desulfobulbaceae bacterium]|nr:response regulator [Candidatus Kapabacteria bacterium]MBS3999053.1 response regulator [Desulfobulbaceae bacterium]